MTRLLRRLSFTAALALAACAPTAPTASTADDPAAVEELPVSEHASPIITGDGENCILRRTCNRACRQQGLDACDTLPDPGDRQVCMADVIDSCCTVNCMTGG